MFIDLGAELILAAEKLGKKIAVEIKSFTMIFATEPESILKWIPENITAM